MHKIHNSDINIFGVIPLCQFSERARADDTCVQRNTQFQYKCDIIWENTTYGETKSSGSGQTPGRTEQSLIFMSNN